LGNDDHGGSIRTITDLARLAGVNPATVSRALADSPLISKLTKERIQALASAHGFRPNQMARNLRVRRTGTIAIVVPLGHERRQHLSDPFFMAMLGYLADALTETNHDIMLSRVIPDDDQWLRNICTSGMVDGVLVIGQSDQFATIERVAARYLPLVVWGSVLPGQVHCAVGSDNRAGGRLAGERLIARGCTNLAFMGEVRTLELAERHKGLCDATTAAGHLASDIMPAEIAAHVDQRLGRIDGIAAASDVIAMRLVRVLTDRAIRVPADIAVTGFDDLPLAEHTVPRLTTVKQDIAAGARAMVAALFRRIDGDAAPAVELAPSLIVRDSA
jgi:DNA-binding LacI/PurR family transcriptional regulator